MTTALSIKNSDEMILQDIENTQRLCQSLMKTPHYSKMGDTGIFAIVQKARSIGMSPLDALNGGMYFVQGKVEMSGQAMLAIIRAHGHSVSMDPKSTDTCVRMFGRRSDNGDTWTAQFSIEDAKRQGIYRNQWEKMPKVMCMWRCVSQLGRFLFSDILKGVYVQGEIAETMPMGIETESSVEEIKVETEVTLDQAAELSSIILECSPEYQKKIMDYQKSQGFDDFTQMPLNAFNTLKERALIQRAKHLANQQEIEKEMSNDIRKKEEAV